jgi:hypothetical protein
MQLTNGQLRHSRLLLGQLQLQRVTSTSALRKQPEQFVPLFPPQVVAREKIACLSNLNTVRIADPGKVRGLAEIAEALSLPKTPSAGVAAVPESEHDPL